MKNSSDVCIEDGLIGVVRLAFNKRSLFLKPSIVEGDVEATILSENMLMK